VGVYGNQRQIPYASIMYRWDVMGGDKLLNGLRSGQRLELEYREFVGKSLREVIDPLVSTMDLKKILRKIKKYYYAFNPLHSSFL
jgi:hypothetical protein